MYSQKHTESHTYEEKQISTKDFETKNPENLFTPQT